MLLRSKDAQSAVAIEVKGKNEFGYVASAMMEFFLALNENAKIGKEPDQFNAADTHFILICSHGVV